MKAALPYRAGAALLAACCATACTIDKMRAENVQRQQQIDAKEQDLQREEQARSALQAERLRLMDDLQSRELSISEMTQRLQQIRRLNAATAAATQAQREQKALREKQLNEAAGNVRALEQETSPNTEAKARRLEAVRRQLRKTLELLAQDA